MTILFTDVAESTRLSQRLDPEDIHAVMDGVLQRFTSIVESHGGRVLQYAGDSLLAECCSRPAMGVSHGAGRGEVVPSR